MNIHDSEFPAELERLITGIDEGARVAVSSLVRSGIAWQEQVTFGELLDALREPLLAYAQAPQAPTLEALRTSVGHLLSVVTFFQDDMALICALVDSFKLSDPQHFFAEHFPAEVLEGLCQAYAEAPLEPGDIADVIERAGRQGISHVEIVPIASPWASDATGLQRLALSVMHEVRPLYTVKLVGPSCHVAFWSWAYVSGRWRWLGKLGSLDRLNPDTLRRGSLTDIPSLAHWVGPSELDDGDPGQLQAIARALLCAAGDDAFEDLVALSAELALPDPSAFFAHHFGLEGASLQAWDPEQVIPRLMRGLASKGYLEPEVILVSRERADVATLNPWLALRHMREPVAVYRLCWRGGDGACDLFTGDWVFVEGHWRMIRDWPSALLEDPSNEAKRQFFSGSTGSQPGFTGTAEGARALGAAIGLHWRLKDEGADYLIETLIRPIPAASLDAMTSVSAAVLSALNAEFAKIDARSFGVIGEGFAPYASSGIKAMPVTWFVDKVRAAFAADARVEREEDCDAILTQTIGPLRELAEELPMFFLALHHARDGEMREVGPFVFVEDGWRLLPMNVLQEHKRGRG